LGNRKYKKAKGEGAAVLSEKMKQLKMFLRDSGGDAVVESAVLFPIVVLIFAALVLVAMYLPVRASLQKSTQLAATAMAVEKGDTWLFFDEKGMEYYWSADPNELKGEDCADRSETIVRKTEKSGFNSDIGDLTVEYGITDHIIYTEITVTATREIKLPVDLSIIGFPGKIAFTVSSTAAVQNGDEFVRNMGLTSEFAAYISEKYGLTDPKENIGRSADEVAMFMEWK